jgi:biopolymer transport protein TolR
MAGVVGGGGRGGGRRKGRMIAEMNVVPYIDVMLVLLIIFMITAPLVTQGVKVDLPQARSEVIPTSDEEPVIITVAKDGRLYMDYGGDAEEPLGEATIVTRVKAVMKYQPLAPILVKGDKETPYGHVVRAMSLLQQGGVSKVGLLTETPEK